MAETRAQFHEELAQLERQALGAVDLVVGQLDRVLEAVAHQDVELAGFVIADDDRLDGRYLEVNQGILSLLALQAPVAGDLRLVAALLHTIKHIERMGDQCVNIAKLIPITGWEPPVDEELLGVVLRMGRQARSEVVQSKHAFAQRDVALAEDLVRQDQSINRDNRVVFRRAIDIGEQVAFVVSGLFREFSDSSTGYGGA
jgi:phosphate transport system protein